MTAQRSIFVYLGAILCVVLFLSVAPTANAATVRAGESYELSANTEIFGDLYLLAERVLLSGTTSDDVYAGGASVKVVGAVGADLTVAGGSVVVEGAVGGDARVIAGKVTVRGAVEEDLVILAGTVLFEDGARIGGDLLVYAEEIRYAGVTVGVAELRGRAITIDGSFSENVQVHVSESLGLLDAAEFQGTLTYHAPREAFVADGATTSSEVVAMIEPRSVPSSSTPAFAFVFQALMFVLSALLVVWLFPGYVRRFSERAIGRDSGMLALKGFALIFALPVFAVLLLITMLGALVGGVLLMGYLMIFALALICAPVLIATVLAEWLRKREERLRYGWVMLGAVVFALFALVPIVGFIVRLLVVSLAFGTLVTLLCERYWPGRRSEDLHAQPTLFGATNTIRNEHTNDTSEEERNLDGFKDK